MLILVIGGSGSGKSEYAEQRCMELDIGPKLYIATMEAYDEESLTRVARHRKMRSGKGFDTLECYTHLEEALIPAGRTVLLECMSNLVANEMFSPLGRCGVPFTADEPSLSVKADEFELMGKDAFLLSDQTEANTTEGLILLGVRNLVRQASNVVIVTNQVFSDGISYDAETEKYRRNLAKVNGALASVADEVVEVVCGIPMVLKDVGAKKAEEKDCRYTGKPMSV